MRLPDLLSYKRSQDPACSDVVIELLHAATVAAGSYAHLYEAVSRSRALYPDGDTRREVPLSDPGPECLPHEQDAPSKRLALLVLSQGQPLPEPNDLLPRLAGPIVGKSNPHEQTLTIGMLRTLAEIAVRPLDPNNERVMAGWPAYVLPWRNDIREMAVLLLLDRIWATARNAEDPTQLVASTASMVALEKEAQGRSWADTTKESLRELSCSRSLPTESRATLQALLDGFPMTDNLAIRVLQMQRPNYRSNSDATPESSSSSASPSGRGANHVDACRRAEAALDELAAVVEAAPYQITERRHPIAQGEDLSTAEEWKRQLLTAMGRAIGGLDNPGLNADFRITGVELPATNAGLLRGCRDDFEKSWADASAEAAPDGQRPTKRPMGTPCSLGSPVSSVFHARIESRLPLIRRDTAEYRRQVEEHYDLLRLEPGPAESGEQRASESSSAEDGIGNQAKAMASLVTNPEWSIVQIADALGVNRTTPYGWRKFMAAWRLRKEEGKRSRPRGSKDREGRMEAWREPDS